MRSSSVFFVRGACNYYFSYPSTKREFHKCDLFIPLSLTTTDHPIKIDNALYRTLAENRIFCLPAPVAGTTARSTVVEGRVERARGAATVASEAARGRTADMARRRNIIDRGGP